MNIINNRLRIPLGTLAQTVASGNIQNPIIITLTKDCCKEDRFEINFTGEVDIDGETYRSEEFHYISLKELFQNHSISRLLEVEFVNLETGLESKISIQTDVGNIPDFTSYWNAVGNATLNSDYMQMFPGRMIYYDEDSGSLLFQLPYPFVLKGLSAKTSSDENIYFYGTPTTSDVKGVYFTETHLYISSSFIGLDKFEDGVWKLDIDYKYGDFETLFNISDSIFADTTLNCFISDIIGNDNISKEDKTDIVFAYSSLKILSSCPTKDFKLMCNILKNLYKIISKPSNNLKNKSCNEC